jgi:hypothetical protein
MMELWPLCSRLRAIKIASPACGLNQARRVVEGTARRAAAADAALKLTLEATHNPEQSVFQAPSDGGGIVADARIGDATR